MALLARGLEEQRAGDAKKLEEFIEKLEDDTNKDPIYNWVELVLV